MLRMRVVLKLNRESVSKALSDVLEYKKELINAINMLCDDLTKEGVQIAKNNIMAYGAFWTGKLLDGVQGYFDPSTGKGIINVYVENEDYGFNYAQIVEFGSGIVGDGSGGSPDRPTWWKYDKHGYGNAGWYYKGGHWTRGQAPRPFMWDTYQQLLEKAEGLARVNYRTERSEYGSRDTDYDEFIDFVGFID